MLSCSQTYSFTVEAVFANGSKGTTGAPVRPCVAPGAPTGLSARAASGTADQLDVSWNASGSQDGTVTYSVTANGSTNQTTGTSTTVTGLLPGHSYTVSVTASNAAGTSSSASTSGTPGGNLSVSPDFTYFTDTTGQNTSLCPVSPPVASKCYFDVGTSPAPSGHAGYAYPGNSFTAYCESSGGTITNTNGASSSVWYYIAINGTHGFGNSLWWGRSGTGGLPPCPNGL
jgi:serine protease